MTKRGRETPIQVPREEAPQPSTKEALNEQRDLWDKQITSWSKRINLACTLVFWAILGAGGIWLAHHMTPVSFLEEEDLRVLKEVLVAAIEVLLCIAGWEAVKWMLWGGGMRQ